MLSDIAPDAQEVFKAFTPIKCQAKRCTITPEISEAFVLFIDYFSNYKKIGEGSGSLGSNSKIICIPCSTMTVPFSTLAIVLPAAIMLHVTEEFLFPGGFSEWYSRLVPPKTAKTTSYGYLVWINTLMIGICVLPVYLGDSYHGVSIWYCITAIAGINA